MSMPAHDEPAVTRLVAVPPLDEILAGDEPDIESDPVAPLDADQADRWLRRLRLLNEADDADQELANTERARIDLWLTLQLNQRAATRAWLEASLKLHMEAYLRSAGPKAARTITLPNGELKARKQPLAWDYEDEAAFVAWAERTGRENLLRFKDPEPDANAVKKAFDPPPGFLKSLRPGDPTEIVAQDRCSCVDEWEDANSECSICGGSGTVDVTVPGLTITKQLDKITVNPS